MKNARCMFLCVIPNLTKYILILDSYSYYVIRLSRSNSELTSLPEIKHDYQKERNLRRKLIKAVITISTYILMSD